jgi:hypothetical protein
MSSMGSGTIPSPHNHRNGAIIYQQILRLSDSRSDRPMADRDYAGGLCGIRQARHSMQDVHGPTCCKRGGDTLADRTSGNLFQF